MKHRKSASNLSKRGPHITSEDRQVTNITTTVRKKGTLSTSSWRPAHTLDSFVALPPRSDSCPKIDQTEEASL